MIKHHLIILSILIGIQLFGQEIAQWRGAHRDGVYNETGLLSEWPENGPELIWHFDDLGDGHASAAVTYEKVYTTGTVDEQGYIYAFDHQGNLLWKYHYGKSWTESWPGVRSTPLIYQGKLYFLSGYGDLLCLDAQDATLLWQLNILSLYAGQNIRWGVTENLLIDGDKLFCTPGGEINNVVALNKDTGKLIWSSPAKGEKSAYCSPQIINLADKKILVTMTENSILGIDASDGKLLWRHEQTNEWSVHPNTPLFHDGYLYCVSGYGRGGVMLKLSEDGLAVSEVWRNEELDNQMGGVVLLNGRLYGAGHASKKWFCLDWKTGEVVYSTSEFQRGNTILDEGLLYCYDEKGKIGLIKPEEDHFNFISTFKVPFGKNQHWAHLVIHNKRLYVRHGTSLMVYDISGS